MAVRITLRMQFGFDWDARELGTKLVAMCRRAKVDEIMLFYYAEELNNGHDTLAEVRQWIEHSRPYREQLREAGIEVSLNPWHTVLHADRNRQPKAEHRWQNMVDWRGNAAKVVVCPLDPTWRKYIHQVFTWFAEEGFRVIWVDDDIRLHNHGPLEWGGCFCPFHVNEFNRRNNLTATREQIVAAALAPGEPHAWRGLWMDMWDETQRQLIVELRDIVEARGGRLGLMSSGMGAHAAEGRDWGKWWTALAKAEPPVHRPNFWNYCDVLHHHFGGNALQLDFNRAAQPAELESGPEVECFTYGRWHKSFRQIHAQCTTALVLGSNALNISLHDFAGNDPELEPARDAFLAEHREAFDWLGEQFPMTLRTVGVHLPWKQEAGRRLQVTDAQKGWGVLEPAGMYAWSTSLNPAGIPCSARPAHVTALAGPMVSIFSDAEIQEWLRQGLLLDAEAAILLCERGFGPQIGLSKARWITQQDVLYAYEQSVDPAYAPLPGAKINMNLRANAPRLMQGELLPGVQLVSEMRGPRHQVVSHGVYRFSNSSGGRVGVVPWTPGSGHFMDIVRATQLQRLVSWLENGRALGSASGHPWLVPQFLRDGPMWRAAIWNVCPDAVESFTVTLPAGMPAPQRVRHLDAGGRFHDATFTAGQVQLARPMQQWECALLV